MASSSSCSSSTAVSSSMSSASSEAVKMDHYASHQCSDYHEVAYSEAARLYGHYTQAFHAMLYALPDDPKPGHANTEAGHRPMGHSGIKRQSPFVLMHMRFDGFFGFPGGLCDTGESPEDGINRELEEEIGLELSKHSLTSNDRLLTHRNDKTRLCLHFYAKRLAWRDLAQLAKNLPGAPEYGIEVLGPIRVPLHFTTDGTGLGTFLRHRFIGNTREQLLYALRQLELADKGYVEKAVAFYKKNY